MEENKDEFMYFGDKLIKVSDEDTKRYLRERREKLEQEEKHRRNMIKKAILYIIGFAVLCITFYCLFPKYEFQYQREITSPGTYTATIYKCNRITGTVKEIYPSFPPGIFPSVPSK